MRVIGLSSGTSVDGIDAAIVDLSGRGTRVRIRLLAYQTFPHPPRLRRRLLLAQADGRVDAICHLNAYLGELFAQAALDIAAEAPGGIQGIHVIGSHGQTIAHRPHPIRDGRHWVRSTLQIGEPSVIAERTGVLTVADFRPRDLAAGGQGAPLTPLIHHRCFSHPRRHRLVVNLGGITNVTWLPAGRPATELIAFDTGPGNMLIDGLVEWSTKGRRTMDRGGRLAAAGAVEPELLRWLLRRPYLGLSPPKSTGRELFGGALVVEIVRRTRRARVPVTHLIATATAFTVHSIVDAYQRFLKRHGPVDDVIVGGGGVYNDHMMQLLREGFAPSRVDSMAEWGVNPKAIEAMAFALLAFTTVRGESNNLPGATGADRPVILGKIIPVMDYRTRAKARKA